MWRVIVQPDLQPVHSWLVSGGHQISARFYRLGHRWVHPPISLCGNEGLRLRGGSSRGLKYGSHRDGLMFGRIPWMLERRVTSPWAMDPSELDDVREHHPWNGPPGLRLSQFGLIRHLYEDCHNWRATSKVCGVGSRQLKSVETHDEGSCWDESTTCTDVDGSPPVLAP